MLINLKCISIMKQNYKNLKVSNLVKKGFFLASFALACTGVNAQVSTFPFTETFEDASPTRSAWTQIYEVNNMSWTYATSPTTGGTGVTAYEGTKFANYPGTSHNFDKTKLVSPVLDLSNYENASVSFYFRNPFWSPDQNWLRIFYRTSSTSPWVQLAEYHSNVTAWTNSGAIALPNPSATYQIAVECETDYGYSTTVDALTVTATQLGVNEFAKAQVRYYPNPAGNVLNFSSPEAVSEIQIFNLFGQKVLDKKLNANEGQIDVSNLAAGNYVVQTTTSVGTESFKLAKK